MAGLVVSALQLVGCTAGRQKTTPRDGNATQPLVLVVAPVINLSNSADFDPLRITDILATEFLGFANVCVVPVNLALTALAQRGGLRVETPDDAFDLAREFGADATIVVAVTEYDPYDPPVVGLVMQWYEPAEQGSNATLDRVSASRQASSVTAPGVAEQAGGIPQLQVQRVFNAAHQSILDELKSFAAQREGHAGPYGWRKYYKSQELFIRYCCQAIIRTMLLERTRTRSTAALDEAEQ